VEAAAGRRSVVAVEEVVAVAEHRSLLAAEAAGRRSLVGAAAVAAGHRSSLAAVAAGVAVGLRSSAGAAPAAHTGAERAVDGWRESPRHNRRKKMLPRPRAFHMSHKT